MPPRRGARACGPPFSSCRLRCRSCSSSAPPSRFRARAPSGSNPGFDAEHVAYFNIAPARAGYRGEKATLYAGDVRRRLESLPFVESMSYSWVPPPFWFSTADIFLPGQNPVRPEDRLRVPVNWVSAGFFETLRIPVIHGRGIEQRDIDQGRPLVVVNEALARRLWASTGSGRAYADGGREAVRGRRNRALRGAACRGRDRPPVSLRLRRWAGDSRGAFSCE